jgi:glycosyltransferase involved in cell wall biosynthesis
VLHLAGIPYTRRTPEYATCAYTSKSARLFKLVGEHEPLQAIGELTDDEIAQHFGTWDGNASPNYPFDAEHPGWKAANARAIDELADAYEPGDLVLLTAGTAQAPIVETFPDALAVEWTVGYSGVIGAPWRIYESHTWAAHVMGSRGEDGRWFDAVVPNFFDEADFPPGDGSGGYLAWVGRWDARKGQAAAVAVAERTGLPLRMAGPGYRGGQLLPRGVEHVGPLGETDRARFYGQALALLAPTEYVEPFGGVAVEAMLCGTPAVTSDWGAFTETVPKSWRFRTLAEAVRVVEGIAARPGQARQAARNRGRRYTIGKIRPRLLGAFDRVRSLLGEGWYAA